MGGGVGIVAGVSLAWDGQSERRSGHHRGGSRYGRRWEDVIRYYREAGPNTGVLNADGNVYIPIATCSTEKVWEMRTVVLTYQDPWTAGPSGSQAAIFSGSLNPGPSGVRMGDLMLMGIAIPASVTWSHDQQLVYGGATLYVVIHTPGASPGLYAASASMMEYDWEMYRRRT